MKTAEISGDGTGQVLPEFDGEQERVSPAIEWLLRPGTKPCRGCDSLDPHDSHLTLRYRLRLWIYGMLYRVRQDGPGDGPKA